MNESVYQEVFDLVQDYLPEEWTSIVLFVGYTEGSYSMKYYVKDNDNDYIDCFKLNNTSRTELIKLFIEIDEILSKERELLDRKNKWTIMTFMVDNTGKMKAEFEYDDHSEDLISYERKWRDKYL